MLTEKSWLYVAFRTLLEWEYLSKTMLPQSEPRRNHVPWFPKNADDQKNIISKCECAFSLLSSIWDHNWKYQNTTEM